MEESHVSEISLSQQYPCWEYRKIHALIIAGQGPVANVLGLFVAVAAGGEKTTEKQDVWRHDASGSSGMLHEPCLGLDFVFDQTEDACQFKCLPVVNELCDS